MRVRATMGPGEAPAKRYAALYPHPGVHAAQCIMARLDMCPPDAAHTGPDGESLLVTPLVLDVAAEFAGALSVMGACAPFGPAAYAGVNMDIARLIASHVNGYAKYPDAAAENPIIANHDIRHVEFKARYEEPGEADETLSVTDDDDEPYFLPSVEDLMPITGPGTLSTTG